MGKSGRVSSAELSVVARQSITAVERPAPPDELNREEADEWRAVVDRLPADWFPRETHQILVQYCRLVVRVRKVSALIDAMESHDHLDTKEYRALLRTQGALSNAVANLATKMRMSQQSTYDKSRKKPASNRALWD